MSAEERPNGARDWLDWYNHLDRRERVGLRAVRDMIERGRIAGMHQAEVEAWEANLAKQGIRVTQAGKLRRVKVKPEDVRP